MQLDIPHPFNENMRDVGEAALAMLQEVATLVRRAEKDTRHAILGGPAMIEDSQKNWRDIEDIIDNKERLFELHESDLDAFFSSAKSSARGEEASPAKQQGAHQRKAAVRVKASAGVLQRHTGGAIGAESVKPVAERHGSNRPTLARGEPTLALGKATLALGKPAVSKVAGTIDSYRKQDVETASPASDRLGVAEANASRQTTKQGQRCRILLRLRGRRPNGPLTAPSPKSGQPLDRRKVSLGAFKPVPTSSRMGSSAP